MVAKQARQPEAGAQHHQPEQDAQSPHPATRFGQPEGEARQGRHQQPGQAHAKAERREDEPELAEWRRQRKGHCGAEEGGRAGGRQQGGETPLQEVAAEPLAAAGGEASAEIAGQADFEQPQQVGAKQQGHRHHEADEAGALELDPPADGALSRAQQAAHGRQHPEGGNDPGAGGEELLAYLSLFALLLLQHGTQFQGQHRQHAGHQVEDEAAEQRRPQQPDERLAWGRQGEGIGDGGAGLPGLIAAAKQQAEGLATQVRGIPLPAVADRDPGDQGVAAHLERGLAELGPLQCIDEERRLLPALCPLGAQLQLVVLVAELDPGVGGQCLRQGAHGLGPAEVETGRRLSIHRQGEGVVGQDADVAAGGEAQGALERLPGRVVEAQGEAHLLLITLGAEPGHLEGARRGPVPLEVADRLIPQDLGRYAPFPRAAPVGFPAGFEGHLEQDAGVVRGAAVGLQLDLGVIVLGAGEPARIAGQSAGLPQQAAQQQARLEES